MSKIITFLFSIIFLFSGCIDSPSSSPTGTGSLSVQFYVGSNSSRFSSISPELSIENFVIEFKSFNGIQSDKEDLSLKENSITLSLAAGTWGIYIHADDSEGNKIAERSFEDIEITEGEVNSIEAELIPAAGVGNIEVTLDLSAKPADVTVESVAWTLYKGVTPKEVDSGLLATPYILLLSGLESGTDYYLVFKITTNTEVIIAERIVDVFADIITSGTISLAASDFKEEVKESFIANHLIAKESVLRAIPESAINAAKDNLHIMYCGTSHSSQTVDGMRGLMEYKSGDNLLYAVTFNGESVTGSLDIDYRPTSPVNVYSASDLSNDGVDSEGHTQYFYRTVEYLEHEEHSNVNVVMWSWCSISGHNVQIYLDNFSELINMYKAGGLKGRTKANAVTFVMMTGYAYGSSADAPEPPYIKSPYQNHKRIVDFAVENEIFCLDYWSQDVYNYGDDSYKPEESGNENVQHYEWVNNLDHTLGNDWFETRDYSSGTVEWPAHCDGTYPQHLTSNRRAYAAWWIFARIAGWNG